MEKELEALKAENAALKAQLGLTNNRSNSTTKNSGNNKEKTFGTGKLTAAQIERYSRQSILDDFRPEGTAALVKGRVLIVGAGGLGSSSAMYLATAGVGFIRLVDHDVVERSNLHRQIIHLDSRCGLPKCESAKMMLQQLNPTIEVEAIQDSLRVDNAMELLEGIDVVLDATDNVAARYLINDACVVAGVPLVSGAAIRWEGQLTVYGYTNPSSSTTTQQKGACYRCMFPKPPPQAAVGSCSDTGVVGAVPGTIGVLQAIEVQKILMKRGDVLSGRMLLFNSLQSTFRTIKMRPWQKCCAVCGENPTITRENTFFKGSTVAGEHGEYLSGVCAAVAPSNNLPGTVTCQDLSEVVKNTSSETGGNKEKKRVFIDVRAQVQHELCSLPNFVSVDGKKLKAEVDQLTLQGSGNQDPLTTPFLKSTGPTALDTLVSELQTARGKRNRLGEDAEEGEETNGKQQVKEQQQDPQPVDVFVMCRRGILSHADVTSLQKFQQEVKVGGGEEGAAGSSEEKKKDNDKQAVVAEAFKNVTFRNVKGGLNAWNKQVDAGFPLY